MNSSLLFVSFFLFLAMVLSGPKNQAYKRSKDRVSSSSAAAASAAAYLSAALHQVVQNNRQMQTKRVAMVTGLKPEKIQAYKALHARVWPGVLKEIKNCHIQNYSIYLSKINNDYFLFSYFEYSGQNYQKDMQAMAHDSTTAEWWKLTAPMQIAGSQAIGSPWTNLEEVFHLN